MTTKLQTTGPARIWLQVSDDTADRDQPFPHDRLNYEITWCEDSVLAAEVEYVRADLVKEMKP